MSEMMKSDASKKINESEINTSLRSKINIVNLGKSRCYFEDIIGYIKQEHPDATETPNIIENRKNIVFGMHEVCKLFLPSFDKDDIIIFNTEQLFYGSEWVNSNYISILENYEVMDYCNANSRWLKSEFNIDCEVFTFGYYPIYTNIDCDIDVLFYGTYTEERWQVFESIKHLPLNIRFEKELWGEEKKDLINRSKIILNLHRYNSKLLQIVKLFPLISSDKIIISEHCGDEDDYIGLPIIFCNREDMEKNIMSCIHTYHTSYQ